MKFAGTVTGPDLAEMLGAMTWGNEEADAEALRRYFTIEEMTADGTVVYLDCKLAKPPREIRPGVFEIEFVPPSSLPPALLIERVDVESHEDWRALNEYPPLPI